MRHPTITVVVATFNSQETIAQCLSSVRKQHYPQENIHISIVDGGSSDRTLHLVKKFTKDITKVPLTKQNAEYNKGVGVRKARGELILLLDDDNVLPHRQWLSNMINPLLSNKKIVASEPIRYHHDKNFSPIDRYLALIGGTDPLPIFLGKADKLSYWSNRYSLYGSWKDEELYYIVRFNKSKIPTLGANGFLVRRAVIQKYAHIDEEHFFHIDVNVDLIRNGFNIYAFTKDSIIHFAGYRSVLNYFQKRMKFVDEYYFRYKKNRRYSVYTPNDRGKLIRFIVYSLTFIIPLYDSMRGYYRVRDKAWFLHPFVCFLLVLLYGFVTIRNILSGKNFSF